MGKRKVYIQNESKGYAIALMTVFILVLVIVAILSLLPGRSPKIGDVDKNGVARSFLFPFVFIDEHKTLFILNDDLDVTEIDDNAHSAVHDVKKNKVYYIRENTLYEYNIKKNLRVALAQDIDSYSILADRSGILLRSSNNLKLYMYSGKKTIELTEIKDININNFSSIGDEYFLYIDNIQESEADLFLCSAIGKSRKIASNINIAKTFGIAKNDKYIYYYIKSTLHIAERNGDVKLKLDNAQVLTNTNQPVIIESNTRYLESKNKKEVTYILANISEDGSSGDLMYMSNYKAREISNNVNRIIYNSIDDKLVVFAKDKGKMVEIYKSKRGSAPELLLETTHGSRFIYDRIQGYLYINEQTGNLLRVNVYDKSHKVEKVADNAANIYDYLNKAIVMYEDEGADNLYYILENNKIDRVPSDSKRLYGFSDDAYLFVRSTSSGKVTLDIVTDEGLKRITGDLKGSLFFNKNFEEIIFQEGNKLYLWKKDKLHEIGEYSRINSVAIME